jgi:hypothetical protein
MVRIGLPSERASTEQNASYAADAGIYEISGTLCSKHEFVSLDWTEQVINTKYKMSTDLD